MKIVIEESEEGAVTPFPVARREFEAAYCGTLLTRTSGNIAKAARLAGKERRDFYALMRRAGIDPARFRTVVLGDEVAA